MTETPELRRMAQEIVAREGGYVDDPDDPGGATNHGVTLGTLRRLGRDLDGDGDVDRADLRRLGESDAAEIFLRDYFHAPRLGELPQLLQPSVFDMYVNAGAGAVRLLQRLLNDMGESLAEDGVIGPQTVAAARRAAAAAPDHIADAYGIARRNHYFALADRRPASRKFARSRSGGKGGWIRRAESFISPRFRLTDAQFRARVAAWA
ncbi:peptidoglycan-binding protein [Yangia mangrovi]|uniref:Peptidoglycan-binding protein n=1 Tax=Alloyangia mangrovi TaxID=1779329 RepID=A0ABT2KHL9_9RHOB|nr:holin-associated N-acetylmuramidase [Alloyangia mangrovi]MCA0940765.1 peptidoglycan-binding protein [Alloyangia pacifica]MCA0946091.1 peptidoglycan-binding protein [Alloyangia pacifica]MCT4369307.1 peptidoglycan-binding protein [Alloyangia mangrovi]